MAWKSIDQKKSSKIKPVYLVVSAAAPERNDGHWLSLAACFFDSFSSFSFFNFFLLLHSYISIYSAFFPPSLSFKPKIESSTNALCNAHKNSFSPWNIKLSTEGKFPLQTFNRQSLFYIVLYISRKTPALSWFQLGGELWCQRHILRKFLIM